MRLVSVVAFTALFVGMPFVASAQKGPSVPAPNGSVLGVSLEAAQENAPNNISFDGVTASVRGQITKDGSTLPVYEIVTDQGERFAFEGEPTYFNFLPVTLHLVQLDPFTPEPELIASSYTGGAHCCERIQIAFAQPEGSWTFVEMGYFDGGFVVVDADEDGLAEIQVYDQSFLYTFDCYACMAPPPLYLTLQDGEIQDLSSRSSLAPRYEAMFADLDTPIEMIAEPGRLATWVALNARLGLGEDALRTVADIGGGADFIYDICEADLPLHECPDSQRRVMSFPEFLQRHLINHGYLPGDGKG